MAQEVGGKAEDVGVVVRAGESGGEFIVGDGSADALDLVGGDAHADARAADEDARVHVRLDDCAARALRDVRVVGGARELVDPHEVPRLLDGFLDGREGELPARRIEAENYHAFGHPSGPL